MVSVKVSEVLTFAVFNLLTSLSLAASGSRIPKRQTTLEAYLE